MSGNDATIIHGSPQDPPATTPALPPSPLPDLELLAELGRGGMGVVYRARQTYLDRMVALKLLLVADGAREFTARFQREAKLLASLQHPHIVACHQAGLTADNHPYLVMEYIDGPDLKRWVAEHGPLGWREAVLVVRDLAAALGHAHDHGIIHRDVKPENVLLAPRTGDDPFPWTVKLVDLGLARPTGGDMSLTRQGTVMGTPATMAPEQFDNPDGVDFRADIYGLGCVLHHILTGQPAFTGQTLAQLVAAKVNHPPPDPVRSVTDLPPAVGRLVTWMLERDRDRRPASYRELMTACTRLLGGATLGRRGNRSAWIGVTAVLAACGLGAALALTPTEPPPPAPLPSPVTAAPRPVPDLASITWGPSSPFVGPDRGSRLMGWTPDQGAQWDAAEVREAAIAGFRGRLTKDPGPLPWRIAGSLHLLEQDGLVTDALRLGVRLVDGQEVSLKVQNLGRQHLATIVMLAKDGDQPLKAAGPAPVAKADSLPCEILVDEGRLLVRIAGQTLGPVPLPALPTACVIAIEGPDPGEFSHLTLQHAAP